MCTSLDSPNENSQSGGGTFVSPPSDVDLSIEIAPPTKPGFYKYSSGAQVMIFLLDRSGQWHAIFDNGDGGPCVWGYIEQALGVWDLIPIDEACYEGKKEKK